MFEYLSLMQPKQKIMVTSIIGLSETQLQSRLLFKLFYFYKCIVSRPENEQAR